MEGYYSLCKLELPQFPIPAILGIAIGLPMIIAGAIIAIGEYAHPKPKPSPEPPIGTSGAPFKM